MCQHLRYLGLARVAGQLVRARVQEPERRRAQCAVAPEGLDEREGLIGGRQTLKECETRLVDRHQPERHLTHAAERALAADEEIHGVAAGLEPVADRVLRAGLREAGQAHRAWLTTLGDCQSIAFGAIDTASKRQRASGRELHGEPDHPVARSAEAEGPRSGRVGFDHAAHRRTSLGRVERQLPTRCLRGELGLQIAQRRAGEHPDGGRRGVQLAPDDAAQAQHRHEVRRCVGHGEPRLRQCARRSR
jgi:hypothetical protein